MVDCRRGLAPAGAAYRVCSGSNKGVISQVATNVGCDDLAVYAIAWHKIDVLSRLTARRCLACLAVAPSGRHTWMLFWKKSFLE